MAEAKIGTLQERLKTARAASQMLAAETGALNDALQDAERTLVDLQLGLAAGVDLDVLDDDDDPDADISYKLWFANLDKEGWGLFIAKKSKGRLMAATRLVKTSREVRLQAADKLEALVSELLDRAESLYVRVCEGVLKVEGVTDQLREAKP
jgi:hypothetical protein